MTEEEWVNQRKRDILRTMLLILVVDGFALSVSLWAWSLNRKMLPISSVVIAITGIASLIWLTNRFIRSEKN